MMRRRSLGLRLVTTGAATALGLAGLAALAPTATAASCEAETLTRGDLDGDGVADAVVGMPWQSDGAGAVDIRYSGSPSRLLRAGELGGEGGEGTSFGAAVAIGDLDGDGCADLVIGSSREGGTGSGYPGAVHIVFGGPGGIVDDSYLTLPYTRSTGDSFDDFGTSLALERPLNDTTGVHDLFVGAPGRTVGGKGNAGGVVHYAITPGGADRVTVTAPVVTTQDSAGVPGAAEANDRFGEVLTAGRLARGVVAGAPGEDVGARVNAGGIWFLPVGGGTANSYSQNSPGVSGSAEGGDHFGAALSMRGAYLAVGVPGENKGRLKDSGMVHIFRQSASGALTQTRALDQDSPGVPGTAEAGDEFGAAVAVAVAPGCQEMIGGLIGAPGEDIGSKVDAGAVTRVNVAGGCPAKVLRQGNGLGGAAEAGDRLGEVIGVVRGRTDLDEDYSDTVLYGVPLEDIGAQRDAGMVQSTSSLLVNGQRVASYQFSGGVLASWRYGMVLSSASD